MVAIAGDSLNSESVDSAEGVCATPADDLADGEVDNVRA